MAVITPGLEAFDESPIRDAERRLATALQSSDPTAWVYEYAEDAVFDAGGEHVAQGREALLAMAHSMHRLSDVTIRALRTEGIGNLAAVWCEGSWTSGTAPDTRSVAVRGIIVWRREPDGQWRVVFEHMS
jgi:ketosteroid isomerase-like protein